MLYNNKVVQRILVVRFPSRMKKKTSDPVFSKWVVLFRLRSASVIKSEFRLFIGFTTRSTKSAQNHESLN